MVIDSHNLQAPLSGPQHVIAKYNPRHSNLRVDYVLVIVPLGSTREYTLEQPPEQPLEHAPDACS